MQTNELIIAILGGTGIGGGLYHLITLNLRKRKMAAETLRQEFMSADEITTRYLAKMNELVAQIERLQQDLIIVRNQLQRALEDVLKKESVIDQLMDEIKQLRDR